MYNGKESGKKLHNQHTHTHTQCVLKKKTNISTLVNNYHNLQRDKKNQEKKRNIQKKIAILPLLLIN